MCAGRTTNCTGGVASVWSGRPGARYCKVTACRSIGKERGDIVERSFSSASKRSRKAVEDEEAPTDESEWWPSTIDSISAVQCATDRFQPRPARTCQYPYSYCTLARAGSRRCTSCHSSRRARTVCHTHHASSTSCTAASTASRTIKVCNTLSGANCRSCCVATRR